MVTMHLCLGLGLIMCGGCHSSAQPNTHESTSKPSSTPPNSASLSERKNTGDIVKEAVTLVLKQALVARLFKKHAGLSYRGKFASLKTWLREQRQTEEGK